MEASPAWGELLARPEADERDPPALAEQLERLHRLAIAQGWADRWHGAALAPWYIGYRRVRVLQPRPAGPAHIVVALAWSPGLVPGPDVQELLLLDATGGLADALRCHVNARLTQMGHGRHFTEVLPEPAADGAVLVVRFEGEEIAGNFSHGIRRGEGEWEWFSWSGPVTGAEWTARGLCRVGLTDGRFRLLFPTGSHDPG